VQGLITASDIFKVLINRNIRFPDLTKSSGELPISVRRYPFREKIAKEKPSYFSSDKTYVESLRKTVKQDTIV